MLILYIALSLKNKKVLSFYLRLTLYKLIFILLRMTTLLKKTFNFVAKGFYHNLSKNAVAVNLNNTSYSQQGQYFNICNNAYKAPLSWNGLV